MSIDAQVQTVLHHEDGSGELHLIDRPALPGQTPGCAGQRVLTFDAAPRDVTALQGRNVWGGSSVILLDNQMIARREGYTKIRFTVPNFHGAELA